MLLIILESFILYNLKQKQSKTTDKIKKRLFMDTNISKFKQLLEETNFDQIMEINCPNEAFDKFMFLYMGAFEIAFPIKEMKTNKKYIKRDPWVTSGLLTSSRTKAKLLKKNLKILMMQTFNLTKSLLKYIIG